jgi:hypothetical protein
VRTKMTAIAALAAAAVTLATIASAGSVAVKQRVAIEESANGTFVLMPLTPGAIERDTGTATFCCWTERHAMQDGQAVDIDNPRMTLTLKRGTLVARNQIGWLDVPGGLAVMTGTWKVISGTGDYDGLTGGGRAAGVQLANGHTTAQFEGFLSPR